MLKNAIREMGGYEARMKKLTNITQITSSKNSVLLLGLFIGITTTTAQELHCTVIDAQTQDTIAYANATYRSLKITTAANQHGIFNIARHNGELLEITSVGYKPRKIKITEKTPDKCSHNINIVVETTGRRCYKSQTTTPLLKER